MVGRVGFMIVASEVHCALTRVSRLRSVRQTNAQNIAFCQPYQEEAEAGISQINLTYDNELGFEDDADDASVGLVALLGMASFVIDGELRVGGVGDLELVHADREWRRVETATGYHIELEIGEVAEHRVPAEGKTDFDLRDDATNFRSASGNTGYIVILIDWRCSLQGCPRVWWDGSRGKPLSAFLHRNSSRGAYNEDGKSAKKALVN